MAGHRERRTALLYAMSRELAGTRGQETMANVAVRHISEVFDSQIVVLLPDASGRIQYPRGESISGSFHSADLDVAQWVQDHGEPGGLGTNTLPASQAVYLPLKGSQAVLGVLGVLPANPRRVLLPEQFHLLETFAGQLALALERAQLAEQAQRAGIAAEVEALRNTLLASISHDLRTPLAVIAGACSRLAEGGERLEPEERRALARSVYEQSRMMSEMVAKVLNLIRLESGGTVIRPEWVSLEEIVGSALHRLREPLASHQVTVNLAEAPVLAPSAADHLYVLLVHAAHHGFGLNPMWLFDAVLRNQGITTLLFAGVNLDRCVITTLQDATYLGYDCILIEDCTATVHPEFATQSSLLAAPLGERDFQRLAGGTGQRSFTRGHICATQAMPASHCVRAETTRSPPAMNWLTRPARYRNCASRTGCWLAALPGLGHRLQAVASRCSSLPTGSRNNSHAWIY